MDAKELRIGNWVNLYAGTDKKEAWIHTQVMGINLVMGTWFITVNLEGKEKSFAIKHFKPIELDLIDFGFNCKNPYLFCTGWDEDVCLSDIPVDIKYAHQFQNLYFAIKGEELIKKSSS